MVLCVISLVLSLSVLVFAGYSPTYGVAKISSSIKVDGVLDDAGWLKAAIYGARWNMDVTAISHKLLGRPIMGYMAYDNENIYIAVMVTTLKPKADDGNLWSGDEVEPRFVLPNKKMVTIYANFNGKVYSDDVSVKDVVVAGKKTEWGYTMEFKIPFTVLGVSSPKPGDEWKFFIGAHDNQDNEWPGIGECPSNAFVTAPAFPLIFGE